MAYTPRPPVPHGRDNDGVRGRSVLGIIALVIGILGVLLGRVPLLGSLSIFVGGLGALLAFIGLLVAAIGRTSGVGYPIAGGLVSILAIIAGFAQATASAKAIVEAVEEQSRLEGTPPPAELAELQRALGLPVTAPPVGSPPGKPPPDGQDEDAEVEWLSARKPIRHGDVELTIREVAIRKAPLRVPATDIRSRSKESLLLIKVQVKNLSKKEKIQYKSWTPSALGEAGNFALLYDSRDDNLVPAVFGPASEVVGHRTTTSIQAGKTLTDLLVFTPPREDVKHLNLELPAANFGGKGRLHVRIPAKMIERGAAD